MVPWRTCVSHNSFQERRARSCAEGLEMVSETAIHLPYQSFLSLQETKAFTCQLPCILEHQMHTTVHARPDNLSWLWEAMLHFANYPFHFNEEQCFFSEEDNSILSPVGETWKQTKPLLASTCPKKFNLFFQRSCYSFIHGSGSAFSLSSLVASAFSSASFKCTEHLQ